MNADKQAVRRFIDELQAVVQIRNFLLPDRFGGIVMDGDILPPRHDRVKPHHAENSFQLQRNFQIDPLSTVPSFATVPPSTPPCPASIRIVGCPETPEAETD